MCNKCVGHKGCREQRAARCQVRRTCFAASARKRCFAFSVRSKSVVSRTVMRKCSRASSDLSK